MEDSIILDRIKARIFEIRRQVAELEQEREKLVEYLHIHDEFSNPSLRLISGREIDAHCLALLKERGKPMTTAELVEAMKNRYEVCPRSDNPEGLVSSRMSMQHSVVNTSDGWSLALIGIGVGGHAIRGSPYG